MCRIDFDLFECSLELFSRIDFAFVFDFNMKHKYVAFASRFNFRLGFIVQSTLNECIQT